MIVTPLRDPEGGPHYLLVSFTSEFTKQYLGLKNGYVFPRLSPPSSSDAPTHERLAISFPSLRSFTIHLSSSALMSSPWISSFPIERACAASSLTSPEPLIRPNILPARNDLPLALHSSTDHFLVFRKAIKTLYGREISAQSASTLLDCRAVDEEACRD